jgi:hypothetical protein
MSDNRDNYWADDEEDDETSTPVFESDSDLVKRLRKQLKAEQRRNKDLETSYGELTKAQKERILKDVLTSKGVNQKIAQFIPSDIEASEDAINAWLDANGEVFGNDIAAMQRMDSVLTNAETPASSNDLQNRLANANTEEEILSILSGQ